MELMYNKTKSKIYEPLDIKFTDINVYKRINLFKSFLVKICN